MRVLIVSHAFPPGSAGGAEICAHGQAATLARGGDAVLVITREADASRPEYSVRHERQDGFTVAWINNTWSAVSSFEDSYQNEQVNAVAAGLIDGFAPDAAHVHHLTCLSTRIVDTLRDRGVPIFFTIHDYWLVCHRGQLLDTELKICNGPEPDGCANCLGATATAPAAAYAARGVVSRIRPFIPETLLAPLGRVATRVAQAGAGNRGAVASKNRLEHMRGVMAGVTHFLAPSHYMRDRFIAFGIDPSRISVLENGFAQPPRALKPASGERAHASPLRVGFLGSLMVSKAPHLILAACGGLPPGSVTVDLWGEITGYHGDARYGAELRQWLAKPGVRVHGRISHADVATALAQLDVLVVPSIWPENSPLVIREAFLAGVPVVASRIGGIPEAVTDEVNGLLFEPGDVPDLRRVLSRLLNEPDLLPRLRRGIPPVRTLADAVASTRELYVRARKPAALRKRLAAVVLNYRTPDDAFLAARSLLLSHRRPDDVIVVDNHPPRARDREPALHGRVTYVSTGENLGFSGGMNAGIQRALDGGAQRILIVNSDAIVSPDCIARLERALDMNPAAGIAAPLLMSRQIPDRVACAGISFDPRTARMRVRDAGAPASTARTEGVTEVQAVSGAVMLINREVFDAVGLFDTDYFFSFEDLDFCLRAGAAGLRSIVVGGATAFHEGGRSIGAHSTRRLYFGARNHLLAAQRIARGHSAVGRAGRVVSVVALNLAHALRADGGSPGSRLGAVLRGTRDYAFGRFGPDPAATASEDV